MLYFASKDVTCFNRRLFLITTGKFPDIPTACGVGYSLEKNDTIIDFKQS
jgi:hypothetical protein